MKDNIRPGFKTKIQFSVQHQTVISSDTAILVEELGKQYNKHNLTMELRAALSQVFQKKNKEWFWALKEISFEVKKGQVLGIIGKNGSGKSTLLRLLSGISKPSNGAITINGRLASILDIGAGFHPDLSGRENIFLRGRLFGMSSKAIEKNIPSIIKFSGLEDFFDTPIKYYSNGMFLRLAFSFIIHLEADILLFDEVLSVGDLSFQQKCLGEIRKMSQAGKTILLVSHSPREVLDICNVFLWLENGRLKRWEKDTQLLMDYIDESFSVLKKEKQQADEIRELDYTQQAKPPGNETFTIKTVKISAVDGSPDQPLYTDQDLALELVYKKLKAGDTIDLAFSLTDQMSSEILAASPNKVHRYFTEDQPGIYTMKCIIPANWLNVGYFRLNIVAIANRSDIVLALREVLHFYIKNRIEYKHTNKELVNLSIPIAPNLDWQLNYSPKK